MFRAGSTGDLGTVPRPDFSDERTLSMAPAKPYTGGGQENECVGRKVMTIELPVWLVGAEAALTGRGGGDRMLVPPKEQTV